MLYIIILIVESTKIKTIFLQKKKIAFSSTTIEKFTKQQFFNQLVYKS